jgi:manganese transport protein
MTDPADPSSPVPPPPASLGDVHHSVPVPADNRFWRRLFAFLGPAYLISVGYMDPGNWATDLQGGAQHGYRLIWVLLMSNGMAILLQTLSARLGIVTGRDLAQACRDAYPRPVSNGLWVLCEIAIVACDLAEVLGTAVGLHLLFGLPVLVGVLVTAADALLLLGIQRLGIRRMEGFIVSLVFTIGICFVIELLLARPDWGGVLGGFRPTALEGNSLYLAIGIVGATVMPHNLYLHSALVQTRQVGASAEEKRRACRFNLIDSVIALNGAFLVNVAILVLAAAAFHATGNSSVGQLQEAHKLLGQLFPESLAGTAFAVALLCAGQSSTLTGTLAGQIVMEGFLRLHISPALRRFITRSLAIAPAAAVIAIRGETGIDDLLVLSQVVLSLQLPFAVVPLVQFTNDRRRMGAFASPAAVRALAWAVAAAIIGLNGMLAVQQIGEWIGAAGPGAVWPWLTIVPAAGGTGLLLAWLLAWPWLERRRQAARTLETEALQALPTPAEPYRRIGVALEAGQTDERTLRHAMAEAERNHATLVLLHVVQGVAAQVFGDAARDTEAHEDRDYLGRLAEWLQARGYPVETRLGYGDPTAELARLVDENRIDLLVTGSHGHRMIADFAKGTTVDSVRHRIEVPVLVVQGPRH